MMERKKNKGEVRIPAAIDNLWKHELITAHALARAGYVVEFLVVKNIHRAKTPDIAIDGVTWEIKSPKTDKLSAIERNLKRATKQSGNIIIDAQRLSKIHDATVQRFLIKKYKQQKTIEKLLFINRKRVIIDISTLV